MPTVTRSSPSRAGSIVPLLAISLLVIMGGVALVVDRIWIDAARVELLAAAESAALAGARELAGDDLLRPGASVDQRIAAAESTASQIAALNRVAGQTVSLQTGEDGDVRVGQMVAANNGQNQFLETKRNPTCVFVQARLTRDRGNPVALLFRELTGQPAAELAIVATAAVDNRVVGVQPREGFAVPAYPLGILALDPTGQRPDTWQVQVENRLGLDLFGYDISSHSVTPGPDGIPEILLTGLDPTGQKKPNVCLIDVGNGLGSGNIARQIAGGLTVDDFQAVGGQLLLPGSPVTRPATTIIDGTAAKALANMAGECRICLLYRETAPGSGAVGVAPATCTGIVAGRVMQVTAAPGAPTLIVFQPGVAATRTALLDSSTSGSPPGGPGGQRNKYLYKISLAQ